jgi:chromosome segregation ATPase
MAHALFNQRRSIEKHEDRIEELEAEVKNCHHDIDAIREADIEICGINAKLEAFKREVEKLPEKWRKPCDNYREKRQSAWKCADELEALINAAPEEPSDGYTS